MKLSTALRIDENSRVAFVGSGGKTTAITQVASELKSPCLISTTTHLGVWQKNIADTHIMIEKASDWKKLWNAQGRIVLVTGEVEGDRLKGIDLPEITNCLDYCNEKHIPLLIECDGSRQLPLKFPKNDEPLVPELVDTVVVC
ncbi:MAG: selenium cofactor biosynthesis protein YqeC, partial [Anaerolineales bacterium]